MAILNRYDITQYLANCVNSHISLLSVMAHLDSRLSPRVTVHIRKNNLCLNFRDKVVFQSSIKTNDWLHQTLGDINLLTLKKI